MSIYTRKRVNESNRTTLGIVRASISGALVTLSAGGMVGCDSCDLPQFEPGTRFLVTVQNDESVCGGIVNFSGGETFEIVTGGSAVTTGKGCEYTPAAGEPVFRDSRIEFVQCQGGLSPLALSCRIVLPECSDADISLYVEDVPEGSSKISTKYYFNVHGGGGCDTTFPGCFQSIPVTIERL